VVTQGLAPGAQVVVDGVDRLREGAVVQLVTPATGRGAGGHGGGHGGGGGRGGQHGRGAPHP
jgi:multidrug efflux system membrane fusion protein